ncbi:BBE domain-containing protein [Raineyella fluvialis]|uniref:BBE domain-containing protein n=1 Tax=Raineyella fluvialis TaxID=2662261 RepID=UPI001E2D309C|nr:BBE domain-containing protein [Raineyella fluvialis]
MLQVGGPQADTSLLAIELRQLGGAVNRPAAGGGALDHLDGSYAGFFLGMAVTPEMAAQGSADAARVVDAVSGWSTGGHYLNFADTTVEVRDAYATEDWLRLRALRSRVDPDGLFVANHPITGLRGAAERG